jgi:hypothetical protein
MARAKTWKYTKERPKFDREEYFSSNFGQKVIVKIIRPEILKKVVEGDNKTIFQGTVAEIDGKPIEKTIIIKNYDNVMFLKKKITKKKEITLSLTRKYDEDEMETYFDIEIIKKEV